MALFVDRFKFVLVCLTLVLGGRMTYAQTAEHICNSEYRIDSTEVGALYAELDNISFFKDNEFAGTVMKGYSLPGLWIQPKLSYNPIKNIHLELGAHALVYSGAYKYPAYAFHDIVKWKGNQYQKGTHILPFYRAQFAWKNVNVVLGNIYGGSNHLLMEPMYNPELNLTADPEMGLQVLYDLPHFHLDAWIDWQSYIFDLDTHQEAFLVGFSSKVDYTSKNSPFHFYSPFQITIQHRGGEQDITDAGVQTLSNLGVGAGMQWNANRRVLSQLKTELNFVASYQQAGTLWPYTKGFGGYASLSAKLWERLKFKAAYFVGHDYISLMGIPYYGTLSLKQPGAKYDGMQTAYGSVEYSRIFAKYFALGVKADAYYVMPGNMTDESGATIDKADNLNFSFGVYLRVNPRFLIKNFSKKTK